MSDGDLVRLVADLAERPVNYDEATAPPHVRAGWHVDRQVLLLGHEAPGEPEDDGLARRAIEVIDAYEFTDSSILRAVYHPGSTLLGRDILLVGRFTLLRFAMGVRITGLHDEVRDGERRIGWSYQTLRGHLEQGRLTYEVAKRLDDGRVEFRIIAYSRAAPTRNPLYAPAFRIVGRRIQLRFYRNALSRVAALLADPPERPAPEADGLVRVPGGLPPWHDGRPVLRVVHPGR